MKYSSYNLIVFALISVFAISFSWAQDEDEITPEVINVVRPYSPSVSDAFKVKEDTSLPDSVATDKKEIQYTIHSVPVASTFTPTKGTATRVEVERPERVYDNYASLGVGNYTNAFAEFYSRLEVSRFDEMSIFLQHNSSQGGIEDVELDDKYYDTQLNLTYASNLRDMFYRIQLDALHQHFNWYGVPADLYTAEELATIDPAHSYMGAALSGEVQLENSFFSGSDIVLRYFGDSYSSSELYARLQPKFAFEVSYQEVGIDTDISYLSGGFDQSYLNPDSEIAYSYLNLGINPYIKFNQDRFSAVIGAAVYIGMDNENSESDVFVYPRLQASYRLSGDAAIVYAGADGGLVQNTYYDVTQQNPFVSPTLFLAPTDKAYDAFAGLKGKINERFSYDVKGSYKSENNRPLFVANSFDATTPASTIENGYEAGNSFGLTYDELTTLEIFAEAQYEVNKNIQFGANLSYFNYDTDVFEYAWNLPDIKASFFTKANFTEQFYGGLTLFYIGERKEIGWAFSSPLTDPVPYLALDSFVDLNINFGYNLNDQLSIFLKGNNLLGENYQRWLNYPVQGLQFMGGATYKFDW